MPATSRKRLRLPGYGTYHYTGYQSGRTVYTHQLLLWATDIFTGITNGFTIGQDGGIRRWRHLTQQNPSNIQQPGYDVEWLQKAIRAVRYHHTESYRCRRDAAFSNRAVSERRFYFYQWLPENEQLSMGFWRGIILRKRDPTKTYSTPGTYTVKLYAGKMAAAEFYDTKRGSGCIAIGFEVNSLSGPTSRFKNTSFILQAHKYNICGNSGTIQLLPILNRLYPFSTIGNYPITLKIISTDGCTYSYSETVR